MSFTGQLGTSNSKLSNIELGSGSVGTSLILTIAGVSSVTFANNVIFVNSVTLAAIDAVNVLSGFAYFNTEEIDGIASIALLPGSGYPKTLSIDAIATITEVFANTYFDTLTVASVSSLDNLPGLGIPESITITATDVISLVVTTAFNPTVTITAIDSFSPIAGQSWFNNTAIEGISSLIVLPGIAYFDTIELDGISSISEIGEYVVNLTIAGVSAVSSTTIGSWANSQTIAGIATLTITQGTDFQISKSINGISTINTENLYDNLLDVVTVTTLTVALTDALRNTENPASVGSLSVNSQVIFNRTVQQTLTLHQTIGLEKSQSVSDTQTLHITQTVAVKHIHNKTVTQTLTLNQSQQGFRNILHTLHLVQTIVSQKIKNLTVTQTLHITSRPTRNLVSNHHINQTLVFNIPNLIITPLIIPTGRFTYERPNIIITKITHNTDCSCNVILQSQNELVVLPCPQFNDTQNYSGTLNLKRSMTGDTFTYIRRSKLNKLKYTFFCGRQKSLELRRFLYHNSEKVIKLMNWKGEIWYVFITNNPFEFQINQRYQKEQERADVTLEFEGVKVT